MKTEFNICQEAIQNKIITVVQKQLKAEIYEFKAN